MALHDLKVELVKLKRHVTHRGERFLTVPQRRGEEMLINADIKLLKHYIAVEEDEQEMLPRAHAVMFTSVCWAAPLMIFEEAR
ncbi:MAG: hypothetical protein ABJC26_11255 [Gemmatimonadaceae bacterium]